MYPQEDRDAVCMSSSPVQIRQLLFSGVENMKPDKGQLELERTFKVPS